jgi:hypothetical protein
MHVGEVFYFAAKELILCSDMSEGEEFPFRIIMIAMYPIQVLPGLLGDIFGAAMDEVLLFQEIPSVSGASEPAFRSRTFET